jgi:hypothetical protein
MGSPSEYQGKIDFPIVSGPGKNEHKKIVPAGF